MADLDRLEHALARREYSNALAIVLAEWRERRDPELADIARALGARLEPGPPLPRPRKDTFQPAWLALAKTRDPRALDSLLSTLTAACPLVVARSIRRFPAWRARMEALAAFDDDPRMTEALVGVLREARFSGTDVETATWIYEPVIVLLERLRDVRCLAPLRALVAEPVSKTVNVREYFAARLPAATAAISTTRARVSDPERSSRVAAIVRNVITPPNETLAPGTAATGSEAALVDAIVDATAGANADVGPWEVLADYWIERGDLRGELISMALAHEREPLIGDGLARLATLARSEKERLDPAFARVTKNRNYWRGMLDSIDLLPSSAATMASWKAVARSPVLATVRHVGQGAASEAVYESFLTSSSARSISDIAIKSRALLERVSTHEPLARRLVHLQIHQVPTDEWLARVTRETFPALRRLSIIPGKEVDADALVAVLSRWKGRPELAEITLGDWTCESFVLAHERLGIPCLVVSTPWFGGWWVRECEPRVAVRRSTAEGRLHLALEVCLTANEDAVLALITAIGKTHRFDEVTIVGERELADRTASLRRVRAALEGAPRGRRSG